MFVSDYLPSRLIRRFIFIFLNDCLQTSNPGSPPPAPRFLSGHLIITVAVLNVLIFAESFCLAPDPRRRFGFSAAPPISISFQKGKSLGREHSAPQSMPGAMRASAVPSKATVLTKLSAVRIC